MDKLSVICRALGFLGEQPITNPDAPETPAGRYMADHYDESRREIIRRHPWNWAEVWKTAAKTTAPPFKFTDAYVYPADCLRLLIVGDLDESIRDYRIINQGSPEYRKVIACDNDGANTINLCYCADIEILSMWDPLALKCLSLFMAVDAAKYVTGQEKLAETLNGLLTEEWREAVAIDGQEQRIWKDEDSEVNQARQSANYAGGFTKVLGYY
jgi:hypothetical protein